MTNILRFFSIQPLDLRQVHCLDDFDRCLAKTSGDPLKKKNTQSATWMCKYLHMDNIPPKTKKRYT
jgi:hypothetical protein